MLGYFTKNKKTSSEVNLTERQQLAEEAAGVRDLLREELERLSEAVKVLRDNEADLQEELIALKQANALQTAKISVLEEKNADLVLRVADLEAGSA